MHIGGTCRADYLLLKCIGRANNGRLLRRKRHGLGAECVISANGMTNVVWSFVKNVVQSDIVLHVLRTGMVLVSIRFTFVTLYC